MYHKIVIVGNLGRDPELRYTPSGKPVTNFSVAANRKWTNSDGTPGSETTWFRISAWGRLAEVVNEYCKKGQLVMVEGRMNSDEFGNPRVWQTNAGESRASYEVVAQMVKFLNYVEATEEESEPVSSSYDDPDTELPF